MDYATFYKEMNTSYYRADCYHTMKNPDNDATSGNHHVINATYHLVSAKLGGYTDTAASSPDFVRELRFVRSTQGHSPGIYHRHPSKVNDPQTHDDYIGLVASSKILNLAVANDIEEYGKNHNWYYDNLQKDVPFQTKWNYWHGKWPGLTGVIRKAAGRPAGKVSSAMYCIALLGDIYLSKDRSNVSGKILLWLQNSVMRGESKMVDNCIDKWEAYIKEKYPEGYMGQVMGIYHGVDHPFAQGMWGKL